MKYDNTDTSQVPKRWQRAKTIEPWAHAKMARLATNKEPFKKSDSSRKHRVVRRRRGSAILAVVIHW
jgi:hypothetical protein